MGEAKRRVAYLEARVAELEQSVGALHEVLDVARVPREENGRTLALEERFGQLVERLQGVTGQMEEHYG